MVSPPSAPLENPFSNEPRFEMLYRAVEVYRRHCRSTSLLTFQMFLLVAARAPITAKQIAKAIDCTEATVSVALGNLGEGSPNFGKEMGEPLDLVSRVDDPEDARRKLTALTDKGSVLAAQMRATLRFPLY